MDDTIQPGERVRLPDGREGTADHIQDGTVTAFVLVDGREILVGPYAGVVRARGPAQSTRATATRGEGADDAA